MLALLDQVKSVLDEVWYLLVHFLFSFDHIEVIFETLHILSDFLHLHISFENLLVQKGREEDRVERNWALLLDAWFPVNDIDSFVVVFFRLANLSHS